MDRLTAKLNKASKDDFIELIKLSLEDIDSLKIAPFEYDGKKTMAIGVVHRQPNGTVMFDPYFIYNTEEINAQLKPAGHLDMIGFENSVLQH